MLLNLENKAPRLLKKGGRLPSLCFMHEFGTLTPKKAQENPIAVNIDAKEGLLCVTGNCWEDIRLENRSFARDCGFESYFFR